MTSQAYDSLYDLVKDALAGLAAAVDVAECHGLLCGMLCGPDQFQPRIWFEQVTGDGNLALIQDLQGDHVLWEMLRLTINDMDADDFSFQLLLPTDDEPLGARAFALGAWCRGFLAGFGLTHRGGLDQLSGEGRDYLRDLSKICRVGPAEDSTDAAEREFFEIVEYARMGAILLREETRCVTAGISEKEILH